MSAGIVSALLLSFLMISTPASSTVITLHDPSSGAYVLFGGTIDSANGFLAVGQPLHNGEHGEVLLYDGVNGSLITTFVSPSISEFGGAFGWAVEVAGNLLVVGAPGETVNGFQGAGRVYIFNIITSALLDTLVSSNPEHLGGFGRAVDVANGQLAVGAPFETVNGVQAGRAHIFDLQTGTETIVVAPPNPDAENHALGAFGATVNIAESRVIVGAPVEYHSAGRAYVFDTTTGAMISTLVSPNTLVGYFGSSVAIAEDQAFVGSPFESMDGIVVFGRVYVYKVGTGSLVATFSDPNPESMGSFGRSIALVGKNLIVGAPYDNVSQFTSGRVYVFGAKSGTLKNTLVSPDTGVAGSFGCFGNAVDSANDSVYAGAPCQVVNQQLWAGAVYIFSGVIGRGHFGPDGE